MTTQSKTDTQTPEPAAEVNCGPAGAVQQLDANLARTLYARTERAHNHTRKHASTHARTMYAGEPKLSVATLLACCGST